MRVVVGSGLRGPVPAALAFVVFATIAAAGVSTTLPVAKIAPLAFAAVVLVATHRSVLKWRNLVIATVLVILFIPIRRYSLPSSLPFQLEPYRVVVAFVALAWLTSLLIDPRVRLRHTGLAAPLYAYAACLVVSLLLNPRRVEETSQVLVKTLMFTASYFLLVALVPSVLSKLSDIDLLCKTFVLGGSVVAVAAVIESRTGYNVFNHLTRVMPFLRLESIPFANGHDITGYSRGGRVRAYASAEHPIALGAAFAMLLPVTPYLARRTGQRRWWAAAVLLLLGLFATVSRTGFLMLIVATIVLAWFRWHEVRRFWPAILPLAIVIHFAVPGTLGTLLHSFFPKGGLIAQQTHQAVGSGRLATLGPVLRHEFLPNPIFGEGYGTRLSGDNGPGVADNAPITDDQWASTLAQIGVAGTFALAWVFIRAIRQMRRLSRENRDKHLGWLAAGLGASLASFLVGMATFDAFSFVQVTFFFFFFLALVGALLVQTAREPVSGSVAGNAAGQN